MPPPLMLPHVCKVPAALLVELISAAVILLRHCCCTTFCSLEVQFKLDTCAVEHGPTNAE
jgi:hypothetical protein